MKTASYIVSVLQLWRLSIFQVIVTITDIRTFIKVCRGDTFPHEVVMVNLPTVPYVLMNNLSLQ